MSIAALAATNDTRKNFYPTPLSLIDDLLSGIDWTTVGAVLEPSAGKGDIAQSVIIRFKAHSRHYSYGDDTESFDVDCVEIDPDLQHILTGKKLRVVHDDFLTFRTFKRYGAIIMNPPFDRGTEHLLKALDMQQRGGYIACILNAETIDNPFSYARKQLRGLLDKYQAQITYKDNAFIDSERHTGVRIAIVKVTIPYEDEPESTILEGLRADQARRKREAPPEHSEIIKDDFIEAIVDRFVFEAEAGCKLIREYNALLPYLMDNVDKEAHPSPMLSISMGSLYSRRSDTATENEFIRAIRKKYWKALFTNKRFINNMTNNLRTELMESVEKLQEYDFSAYNILTIRVNMQKKLVTGIHQTIMELFDDWTRKYEWHDDNSKNRHYFDGWVTNNAFAVNKRVVLPRLSAYDDYSGEFHPDYRTNDRLSDIEKVFDYLRGRVPDHNGIEEILKAAKAAKQTTKVQFRYFAATFYKKGTCHIEFTDMDVLHKFNLYAARDKNWLPPCYGRKTYKEMDPSEKAVVDSFEGEKSYERVISRKEYFLQEVTGSFLTA